MRGRLLGNLAGGLVLGLLASIGALRAQELATARALQHPVNQSGVMGSITFTETVGGLVVTGTATGLDPSSGPYATLVYDVGSVPGGPTVCEPTVELDGMFVGIWIVSPDGSGVLVQLDPVAPLTAIDTVSIRNSAINDGIGPEAVVACGQIAVHPATP